MGEPKMVSEREAVLRERAAFVAGSSFQMAAWQRSLRVEHCSGADEIAESRRLYPLPKVARPRVVYDPSGEYWRWSVRGGALCYAADGGAWCVADESVFTITRARVRMWADLFANPTEEVEDDGSAPSEQGAKS